MPRYVSAVSIACLAAAVLAAPLAGAQAYVAPRNAMGQPDLGGLWTNATLTTLERPPQYGERLVMTEAEVAKIEGVETAVAAGQRPANPFRATDLWADPGSHVMHVNGEFRTSFLVEPKDGRLPALTAEATQARAARMASAPRGAGFSRGDNPESMTLAERCIKDFGSSSGPPMMPLGYNNTYQIVQSPTDVMILVEMVHDARIVRLTRDRARPDAIRQWMGDSIGWYEGDTLVVETTNFRPGQAFRQAPEGLRLTERFRRINDRQVLYTFEINDPKVFTAPIKAEIAMNATPGPLYEYACHEGNYAMPNILGGQRRADEDAAKKVAAAAAKRAPRGRN